MHREQPDRADDQHVGDRGEQLALQASEDLAEQGAFVTHDEHHAAGAGLEGDAGGGDRDEDAAPLVGQSG
ncbi:hypothetical protein ACF1B0_30210 [Streptomyces anandii]|uniref:hypothetical protein n=1 Tax=Streptomyces anandii TaxID=285454 RepID=UPI0036FA4FD2